MPLNDFYVQLIFFGFLWILTNFFLYNIYIQLAKNGENLQGCRQGIFGPITASMGWIYQEHHEWATVKATRLLRLA